MDAGCLRVEWPARCVDAVVDVVQGVLGAGRQVEDLDVLVRQGDGHAGTVRDAGVGLAVGPAPEPRGADVGVHGVDRA